MIKLVGNPGKRRESQDQSDTSYNLLALGISLPAMLFFCIAQAKS